MTPGRETAAVLLLLALTAFCCLPSRDAPFTFDERAGIAENRSVQPASTLTQAALYRFSYDQTRPLFFVSLLLDGRVHGTTPRGYRTTNLLLHLLAGVALYLLIRRVPLAPGATLAGTAVFLLHPIQSESIFYIWGRSGVLATLLSLAALLLVPWDDVRPLLWRAWRWAGALACLSAALLAKEEPVVVPLLAFIFWTVAEARPARAATNSTALLALPVVGFLLLRAGALGSFGPQVQARGFIDNILGQAVVTLRMLRLIALPHGQSIDPLARVPGWAGGAAALALCAVIAVVSATLARHLLRHDDASATRGSLRCACAGMLMAGAGCLIYWLAPLPDLMSERRAYLPMTGVALAVAGLTAAVTSAMQRPAQSGRPNRGAAAVGLMAGSLPVLLLAVVLAPLLHARSRVWSNPESLWEEARREAPEKARPLINLGVLAAERGDSAAAEAYLDRILVLEPQNAEALYNRGRLRLEAGDMAGAAAAFSASADSDPTVPRTWINLGVARMRLNDFAGAEDALLAALEIDAGDPRALTNLAELFRATGRTEKALQLYRQALQSDPGYAHAAVRLGVALEAEGDAAGALAAYREYLARGPASSTDRDAVLAKVAALEAATANRP